MNAALIMLLRLQWWAKLRRLVRGLGTLRGAVFSLLGLGTLAWWLGPSLWLARTFRPPDPELVVPLASSFILLMLAVAFLPSGSRGAAYFTPAEIDFLFAGPFTRRALVAYKLASTLVGLGLATVLMSASFLPFVSWWIAACVGVFLTLLFVQFFGMVVALAAQVIAERAYTRLRRAVLVGVALVLAAGLWNVFVAAESPDPRTLIRLFRASMVGSYVLAPLDIFGRAITARSVPELATWGSLTFAINLALLGAVFWLDVRWEEATLVASQRAYDRLERVQRSRGVWMLTPSRWARVRIPMVAWLGGAGPLAWRQLTTAVRHPWTLIALTGLALFVVLPGLLFGGSSEAGPFVVLVLGVLFSMWLPCDFRGDLDDIPWLKMLPLRQGAVAAGELAAGIFLTTAVQFLFLGVMVVLAGSIRAPILAVAAFTVPLNVLLFGAQNLLFLLFPARMAPATAADLQHFGRGMVLWLLELIALVACGGVAALVGLAALWLTGWSWTAALIACWSVLTIEAVAVIPTIAWAYRRFDVSLDTPP